MSEVQKKLIGILGLATGAVLLCASPPVRAVNDQCADVTPSLSAIIKRSKICGGSYVDTQTINNVRQCVEEVMVGGVAILDHRWDFTAVPAGVLELTVEAHRPQGSNDNYQFFYSVQGSPNLFIIPNARVNDSCELVFTVPVGLTLTSPITVNLFLQDTNRSGDTTKDRVYIDHLRLISKPVLASQESACGNGLDDDCDGSEDCNDTDCVGTPACCPAEVCDDSQDNDCDGLYDCDDPNCNCCPVPPCF